MEQFNEYFLGTIKNRYADFNGRATRSEYWYYTLFYIILAIILNLMDTYLVNPILGMTPPEALGGGFIQMAFALALIIPSIAIGVRRLHDIKMSGWWLLIGLVPILGGLVLLYFFVQKSK